MLLGITWLCVVCVALLSGYMLVWSRLRRPRALLAHLPSDPQLPLLGNLLQVIGDGRNFFRLLDRVSHLADRMRKPALIWLGPVPNILILDPEDVKTVSHAFIEKPNYYNFAKMWLGDGILLAPGKIWKHNVKNVKNSFKANIVEGFQGIFNEQARRLIDSLTKVEGELADIMPILKLTALEAICQAVFGPVQISESFVSKEHFEAFNRCLELMLQRGLTLWLHPDCIYRHTGGFKNFEESATVLRNVTQMVAAKKSFERLKTKNGVSHTSDSGNEKKFKYLLDVLLDLKESDHSLTEEQINHEVDTIILGGQQTTASTVLFTLLMLGSRPAVQEKLYHEMKSIFGDSSRPVETADLQKMTYCDAVLNETLRLFPPFPTVMRHADTDLQLKSCLIPEGVTCIISIWGAGRSVHTWGPDALEFDPERWLDGRVADKPAAFIPFSYGQRACIGKKYGIAITKTILAWCVRELQFSSQADQLDFKIDIALRPISGHLLQIKRRNKMS